MLNTVNQNMRKFKNWLYFQAENQKTKQAHCLQAAEAPKN